MNITLPSATLLFIIPDDTFPFGSDALVQACCSQSRLDRRGLFHLLLPQLVTFKPMIVL